MNAVLGLRHKRFNVPITSIASFVENINKAYEQFYKDLYGIGVTQDMMQQKRKEVLEIFCSHNTVANLLIEDQGQLRGLDCVNVETPSHISSH